MNGKHLYISVIIPFWFKKKQFISMSLSNSKGGRINFWFRLNLNQNIILFFLLHPVNQLLKISGHSVRYRAG